MVQSFATALLRSKLLHCLAVRQLLPSCEDLAQMQAETCKQTQVHSGLSTAAISATE
jgi:hypothetical protein